MRWAHLEYVVSAVGEDEAVGVVDEELGHAVGSERGGDRGEEGLRDGRHARERHRRRRRDAAAAQSGPRHSRRGHTRRRAAREWGVEQQRRTRTVWKTRRVSDVKTPDPRRCTDERAGSAMASSAGSERDMTPLELMRHRNGLMHSAESIRNGREFETRPTDVFIVTYPKCATRPRAMRVPTTTSPPPRPLASDREPRPRTPTYLDSPMRARPSPRSPGAARRG